MIKNVDGHRYDSDSPVLARWDNGTAPDDSTFFAEELHHNKAGFFFLHCSGGSMSPYAKNKNSSRVWGETIKPLSNDDTRLWVADKLGTEAFERIFSEQNSGNETVKISLILPASIAAQIDETAEMMGRSRAQILRTLIERGLATYERS